MSNQSNKPSSTETSGSTEISGIAETMQNSISSAVKGAKEYNTKFMEFAQVNTEAAFAFAQKLLNVRSPTDFVELSVEHSRKQMDTLTKQTKQLADLAQKVTLHGKS